MTLRRNEIVTRMEALRQQMYAVMSAYGMDSPQLLTVSQQLDGVLNEYYTDLELLKAI